MNQKRTKILIIGFSMNVGGAEKGLCNLLNMIDYNNYDVDLLLFQQRGPLLKQIPKEVHIIHYNTIDVLFQSIQETIKKGGLKHIRLSIKRYIITLYEKIKWKQFDQIRLHRWVDFYKKMIPFNYKEYDVGVAFAGGETAYYLIDKTKCKRKVYFFHSDYSKIDIDANLESQYIKKTDQIITISNECKNSLVKLFPESEEKIQVLQNLTSPKLIRKLSKDFYPIEYKEVKGKKILLSVGRLHKVKGYDIAIEASKILKEYEDNFVWFVVGEGEERDNLEKLVKKHNLSNNFVFIGLKENPYPYILNADIIVQPSRFEGKSIVLDEAKLLHKPIIATNYNSVQDQITDMKTGIIAELDYKSLAQKIYYAITNDEILTKIQKNLENNEEKDIFDINHYMEILCGR